eukprot:scaffold212_cov173-Amphora_coffeaeformis.AAC.5
MDLSEPSQDQEEKHSKTNDALEAAIVLLCNQSEIPYRWELMPEVLRRNITAVTQVIIHQGDLYPVDRSSFPEDVLQEALTNLLASHYAAALKAWEDNIYTWNEVQPTREEWIASERLSIKALCRGLVQDLAEIPKVTEPVMIYALYKGQLPWSYVPNIFRDDLDFCRSVADPTTLEDTDEFPVSMLITIFRHHPHLYQDCQVWENTSTAL